MTNEKGRREMGEGDGKKKRKKKKKRLPARNTTAESLSSIISFLKNSRGCNLNCVKACS